MNHPEAACAADLVYACITHVPLWVDLPSYVVPLCLGQAQGDGKLNLRDLAPQWEPYHPVLGGTAGSFALRSYLLQRQPPATRVGICQYRKFVSRRRISRVADVAYPGMDIIHKASLGADVISRLMWPGDQDFLVSRPIFLPRHHRNMDFLEQYNRVHCIEDLLRFTAEAVEQGVLVKQEASSFLHEKLFIPGGLELGIYPADFWIRSIGAIEQVVQVCVQRYPQVRGGPQARAWSFCAERLGSYLLLRHFRHSGKGYQWARRLDWAQRFIWARRFIGQLNLITESEGARYVAGS